MSREDVQRQKDLPLIGVMPSYQLDEEMLSIPIRYMNAVALAGGAPLALPIIMGVEVQEALLPTFDGFLLSGGQDIDPQRYSEHAASNKLSEFSPHREETEHLVLNYAKRYDVPVLGICRGMQIMNVLFGGTLYQDIDDQFFRMRKTADVGCTACQHRSLCEAAGGEEAPTLKSSHCQIDCYHLPAHEVSVIPGTHLHGILGRERIAVNSMHHQAIKGVGHGLRDCAHDPEGLIEAIEAPEYDFILGVQWHPEFFADSTMQPLFSGFVAAAKRYRKRCDGERPRVHIGRQDCGAALPIFVFDEVNASLNSACL